MKNERGFSLIELLVTMIIASIALFATAVPFMAERSFWQRGKRQVEAQRDAHLMMRSIARAARQSNHSSVTGNILTLTAACGTHIFQTSGSEFQITNNCVSPAQTTTLIDGADSAVTQFVPTIISSKIVKIELQITRESKAAEQLETQIFLRNAA